MPCDDVDGMPRPALQLSSPGEIQKATNRLAFLERLEEALLVAHSAQAAAESALRVLDEAVHPNRLAVLLLDDNEEAVVLASRAAGPSSLRAGARLPSRMLFPPGCLVQGQPYQCSEVSSAPPSEPLSRILATEGVHSYLNLPLIGEGQAIGSLVVASAREAAFSSEAAEIARLAARSLGLALTGWQERLLVERAERRYRNLFRGLPIGLYRTASSGEFLEANPAFLSMLEFPDEASLSGVRFDELFAQPEEAARSHEFLDRVGIVRGFEVQMRARSGAIIWVQNNARAVRDEEAALLYYEGSLQDITERRQAEEQLVHDALHDALTSLPNRAFFMERLGHALKHARRDSGYLFAVLFIDFDRFKVVNDSLGHQLGDQLLVASGRRLERCLRQVDSLARLGGDEFAILLDGIRDVADATRVAERVKAELSEPFRLAGHELFITASVGIALGATRYSRPEDLLRDADIAMYRAKERGLAQHVVFDTEMHATALALHELETDLRRALRRHEFQLRYQPIVSLDSGALLGFEALVRWRHPERGLLLPAEFLGRAEETGLIVPLGRWVIREACGRLRDWQREVPAARGLTVSVNLSGRQFHQAELVAEVEAALRDAGLPGGSLRLEITENVIMENPSSVRRLLARLKSLGVGLDIDDFGTGYSSLNMLSHFPVDTLKTDRSFIRKIEAEGGGREIVRAVISLGHALGMEVVAEGVETPEQEAELRNLGCHVAQGFLFGQPLDAEAALRLIREAPPAQAR